MTYCIKGCRGESYCPLVRFEDKFVWLLAGRKRARKAFPS